MATYNINRFIEAQDECYDDVKEELLNEKKLTHWMWFIFPQIKGLGYSSISVYYALDGIEETKLYLDNKILKDRMYELCNILLNTKSNDVIDIFGVVDSKKLCSSMTLFYSVSKEDIFKKVLDKFFDSRLDNKTITLLKQI